MTLLVLHFSKMSFSVLNEQKMRRLCDHGEVHLIFDIVPALIVGASVVKRQIQHSPKC